MGSIPRDPGLFHLLWRWQQVFVWHHDFDTERFDAATVCSSLLTKPCCSFPTYKYAFMRSQFTASAFWHTSLTQGKGGCWQDIKGGCQSSTVDRAPNPVPFL